MSFYRIFCGCLVVAFAVPTLPAQTPPRPSSLSKHIRRRASLGDSLLDLGSVTNAVYRNKTFGFDFKIPAGWVLRTEEMNASDEDTNESDATNADAGRQNIATHTPKESEPPRTRSDKKDSQTSGRVLLAAFSRPPEAAGEDVNSSILIAAESVSAYPGLKDAAQYFGPVTEVAKAQGFAVVEEPYEFSVGTKKLVRADFQKDVGSRVMRQSTLVMLARGHAVSFTFIGGTEEEVEELVGGLSFADAGKPAK